MTANDPIAALASGADPAAIALIRLSGQGSFDLVSPLLARPMPAPRQLYLTGFKDKSDQVIDEPMVAFFPGPHSFTGEDSVEINCHGSPYIVQSILKALLTSGFRSAEPGEFTRRAFLNGKLDLTAAEGIKELVEAQSHQQWLAARQLATGTLKQSIDQLRQKLIEAMALLEAQIDFPDEGDTQSALTTDAKLRVDGVAQEIDRLINTYESGKVASHGLKVVLMGAPNAGKSTLMNHLLGHERAIVSDIPGTTRDYLEEGCLIKGRLIRLLDVAGIRDTTEAIEALGVKKAMELAQEADIVVYLAAPGDTAADDWIASYPGKVIKLATKADLGQGQAGSDWMPISCKTGAGMEEFGDTLVQLVDQHVGKIQEGSFITSLRHAEALRSAKSQLENFYTSLNQQQGEEILAFELQGANRFLQEVIGVVDSEDILDKIFSQFCVGK